MAGWSRSPSVATTHLAFLINWISLLMTQSRCAIESLRAKSKRLETSSRYSRSTDGMSDSLTRLFSWMTSFASGRLISRTRSRRSSW